MLKMLKEWLQLNALLIFALKFFQIHKMMK